LNSGFRKQLSARHPDSRELTIRITWLLSELDRNGYVVIDGALDGPGLARRSSVVGAVRRSECPGGGELHRLAFVGLDTAFVELVDHPLTLSLVTAMSRICGPAPTPR
jgi:hypothetical protein